MRPMNRLLHPVRLGWGHHPYRLPSRITRSSLVVILVAGLGSCRDDTTHAENQSVARSTVSDRRPNTTWQSTATRGEAMQGQRATTQASAESGQELKAALLDLTADIVSDQLQLADTIVAVAANPQGSVFILERSGGRVTVADRTLRPLGSAGRVGTQVGEFRRPVSLGMLPNGRVAVLDRTLQRVTVLAEGDGGRSVNAERMIPLKVSAESMCTLDDGRMVIYGLSDGMRLHLFDVNGERLRSFAPADSQLSPMAQEVVTIGKIACDLAHDEVLVTTSVWPIVEAFRISTGEQFWTGELRPYRALRLIDLGESVTLESGRAGYSRVSRAFILDDYRVFQTTYDARRDNARADTVVTYVYSRREGAWMSPQLGLPLLFPVGQGQVLYEGTEQGKGVVKLGRLIVADGQS